MIEGTIQCYGNDDVSPFSRKCRSPIGAPEEIEVELEGRWEARKGFVMVTIGGGQPFAWPKELPLGLNGYNRVPVM